MSEKKEEKPDFVQGVIALGMLAGLGAVCFVGAACATGIFVVIVKFIVELV